jgi:hypothetical protein
MRIRRRKSQVGKRIRQASIDIWGGSLLSHPAASLSCRDDFDGILSPPRLLRFPAVDSERVVSPLSEAGPPRRSSEEMIEALSRMLLREVLNPPPGAEEKLPPKLLKVTIPNALPPPLSPSPPPPLPSPPPAPPAPLVSAPGLELSRVLSFLDALTLPPSLREGPGDPLLPSRKKAGGMGGRDDGPKGSVGASLEEASGVPPTNIPAGEGGRSGNRRDVGGGGGGGEKRGFSRCVRDAETTCVESPAR